MTNKKDNEINHSITPYFNPHNIIKKTGNYEELLKEVTI